MLASLKRLCLGLLLSSWTTLFCNTKEIGFLRKYLLNVDLNNRFWRRSLTYLFFPSEHHRHILWNIPGIFNTNAPFILRQFFVNVAAVSAVCG